MSSSFWFETINLGRSIVYIKGSQVIISDKIIFPPLKINYDLANTEDTDEMPHSVVFHQFSFLLKYAFRSHL